MSITTAAKMLQPGLAPCPACGNLQCLCRPRFFAGQLLTEEDLNRLDRYIVEKNRLHNRYVHGWGVACGLEVLCHPCFREGYVTVTPGYALSPCGDDIVVCREEPVNIGELLQKCREDKQRQWDCEPAFSHTVTSCSEKQSWVLYICYEEKPSRGITALRGGSGPACCSCCSCGGSSGCGCGCHGKSASQTKSSYQSKPLRPLPQCEPTVTCEGYTFQIRKAPDSERPKQDQGKLSHRIRQCRVELNTLRDRVKGIQPDTKLSMIYAIQRDLVEVLERHRFANCNLYERVKRALELFGFTSNTSEVENRSGNVKECFDKLLDEAMRECVCSAWLPPCPEPVEENCVPLATITVNCKGGCHIVRVCNWENRRIVPTVPGLSYWFGDFLHTARIAELCDPSAQPSDSWHSIGEAHVVSGDEAEPIFQVFKAQLQTFLKGILQS